MSINKKDFLSLGVATLFLAASCTSTSAPGSQSAGAETISPGQPNTKTITILHTNDMHGSYMPFRTVAGNSTAQTGDEGRDTLITFGKTAMIGGFAHMASAIKQIRSEKGADKVLLVDGGDTFGDDQLAKITKGEAMIRLMNQVGYDLMTLGNHDFDYGIERTRELEQIANFPMKAANIIDEQTKQPLFGQPYIIKEKNGIKVAILSVGYRNTNKTGNPDNMKGLRFLVGQEEVRKYIPELRQQADIVVVVSHEGTAVDKLMAKEVEGIDLIVGAHSHDILSPPSKIGETYVVQAMSDGAVLGETELQLTDKKLTGVKVTYHELWHDAYNPDEEVQRLINELRKPHLAKLQKRVGESRDEIGRQYKSESPFDKLVGNMLLEGYNGKVALLPGVGYGITIKKGPIKSENVYKLLPHPSKIATLTMTGEQLKQTLEQSAKNLKPDNKLNAVGGLIQTAGIKYVMDLTKPIGQRISNVHIGNTPISDAKSYKVVTHTGMLTGLHNYEEIGKGQNINRTEKPLTEFVIEQINTKKEISMPSNMGEVLIKK